MKNYSAVAEPKDITTKEYVDTKIADNKQVMTVILQGVGSTTSNKTPAEIKKWKDEGKEIVAIYLNFTDANRSYHYELSYVDDTKAIFEGTSRVSKGTGSVWNSNAFIDSSKKVTWQEVSLMPSSGNVYVAGNLSAGWLRSSSVGRLQSSPARYPVFDGSSWIYYRNREEMASDIGAATTDEVDKSIKDSIVLSKEPPVNPKDGTIWYKII